MNRNEKVANEVVNRNRRRRSADKRTDMKPRIKIYATAALLGIIASVGLNVGGASAATSPYGNPASTVCWERGLTTLSQASVVSTVKQDYATQWVGVRFIVRKSDGLWYSGERLTADNKWSAWQTSNQPQPAGWMTGNAADLVRFDFRPYGPGSLDVWVQYTWLFADGWHYSNAERVANMWNRYFNC